MDKKRQSIGELIENEVRRQGIPITEFADRICCRRGNVYDIFKRGDKIDSAQLALISRVLNRNFFKDLADDLDLIDLENIEIKKDMENRKAVSQFMEVIPDTLIRMGIEPIIVFSKLNKAWSTELPDFGLSGYPLTFTIGERLFDKVKEEVKQGLKVDSYQDPTGNFIDVWLNEIERTAIIDIPIVFHTNDEWESILNYALNEIAPQYGALCDYYARRIDREIAYRKRMNMQK